jgi:hypothetical protein
MNVFFNKYSLLKVARADQIWGPKSQQCHTCTVVSLTSLCTGVTVVSLTPLCKSQQCHWHRYACHSGVNDTVQWCHWHRCACHSNVNDTNHCVCHSGVKDTTVPCAAKSDFWIKSVFRIICENIRQNWLHSVVIDTTVVCRAVSLAPLWHAEQYHWHHCNIHSGVIDTAVQLTL